MPTIVVCGRDAQITSDSKKHAEEKLGKLGKYFDAIGKIEAILGHSGGRGGSRTGNLRSPR